MPSPADPAQSAPQTRRAPRLFAAANRKAHYYLGLYFLFFLWLFSFSGLLLNHSWSFAEFWPGRKVSRWEAPLRPLAPADELERARAVMRQLGIRGELEWTAARLHPAALSFRATRPGNIWQVTLNPESTRATVERTELNGWGVIRLLHTFTGVRAGDARNHRDWILTSVWVFAMDALSAGLVLMVLTGLYLWAGLPAKRAAGAAALLAGSLACGLFLFGLRLFF